MVSEHCVQCKIRSSMLLFKVYYLLYELQCWILQLFHQSQLPELIEVTLAYKDSGITMTQPH